VVTEAGFGADLGAEKFLHIKCEQSGLIPDAVVLVATIRAIKHHAGLSSEDFKTENIDAIAKGFCNLEKHIENMQQFGLNPVVCINAFPDDTQAEYDKLKELCLAKGVVAIVCTAFVDGGKGAATLAEKVIAEIEKGKSNYKPLYQKTDSIEHKIKTIATQIYGANSIAFSSKSKTQLKTINDLGFHEFQICMAKTPSSFSDNENLIGRPTNFAITVREFEIASGAGFIVPLLGDVMRMPGLPVIPNSERIDIDNDGKISGLS
jgi:formate--tetrahydrofolate ligase